MHKKERKLEEMKNLLEQAYKEGWQDGASTSPDWSIDSDSEECVIDYRYSITKELVEAL